MKVSERIAIALERSDKSQRDLARAMGLSGPTINSMLSKDEIDSIKYLKAVEDLTGYRFHWLRTGEGPEKADIQTDKTSHLQEELLKTKNELIEELKGRISDMTKYQELLEKQIKKKKG